MSQDTTGARPGRGLEVRSIDYVPLDERHGKVWHIGPLWFMSNAQIATLAVGLISITSRRQPDLVVHRDRARACSSARSSWRPTRRRARSSGCRR